MLHHKASNVLMNLMVVFKYYNIQQSALYIINTAILLVTFQE